MYMNHNVNNWLPFQIKELFIVSLSAGDLKIDDCIPGEIPLISSGQTNNGVVGHIDKCGDGKAQIFTKNKITVDMFCNAFYQSTDFYAVSHGRVNILTPLFDMSDKVGLFITALINKEQYKYSYGRAVYSNEIAEMKIRLPVNKDNKPDWNFIEDYVSCLKYKPVTTSVSGTNSIALDTSNWKVFYLHRLFNAGMGNGIDAITTTNIEPKYNYVSRDSTGNGVVDCVDEIEGETPFPAGAMSLALGGSFLGSCFIQKNPFYTAQNVAVLQEKVPLSDHIKLFIATLIRNECKIKYQAFGRELNAHFRKDFTIKLPIKCDSDGIVYDETHEFSDDGYIPDWKWMDSYMKSLPYSDRI